MDNLSESKHYTSLLSALAIALLLPISAQAADNWVNGRTADGQPDLQGLWTNDTITPMERPASPRSGLSITRQRHAIQNRRDLALRKGR